MKVLKCLLILFMLLLPRPALALPAVKDMSGAELGALNLKMGYYAQMLMDWRTYKFIDALEDRINSMDKRKPDERMVSLKQSAGYGSRFDRALQDNAKQELRLEAADSAVDVIAEVYPRALANLKSLDRYYERGDWKEDNQARGMELVEKIRPDAVILLDAFEKLEAAFDGLIDSYEADMIARFEAEYGQTYYWHHARLMRAARQLLPLAVPDMKDFNPAAFKAAFDDYKKISDAYEDYMTQVGSELKKEGNQRIKQDWIDSFIRQSRAMLTAQEENVPRRYANMVEPLYSAYNNMVTNSNAITFKYPEFPRKAVRYRYLDKGNG